MIQQLFLFVLGILPLATRAQDSVRLATLPRALFWENTPVRFETGGGQFTIVAGAKTDVFRDPNVTYNTDSVVTKGISDDCNSVAMTGNTIYYKIAKAGDVITMYYSPEGHNWFLIRHLTFDTDQPLKLGFLAQSPTGERCAVTFSNVHYSPRKISDPYTGE